MSRLIDANVAIERAKNSDQIVGSSIWGTDEVVEFLADCPTVDAVPVVRCRDCKHWMKDVPVFTDDIGRCRFANYLVGGNAYCVYG